MAVPGKSLIFGITMGPHALAVADAALKFGTPLNYQLADVKLVITRDLDGGVRAMREDDGRENLVREAFWFAWSSFFPNTVVLD